MSWVYDYGNGFLGMKLSDTKRTKKYYKNDETHTANL